MITRSYNPLASNSDGNGDDDGNRHGSSDASSGDNSDGDGDSNGGDDTADDNIDDKGDDDGDQQQGEASLMPGCKLHGIARDLGADRALVVATTGMATCVT